MNDKGVCRAAPGFARSAKDKQRLKIPKISTGNNPSPSLLSPNFRYPKPQTISPTDIFSVLPQLIDPFYE